MIKRLLFVIIAAGIAFSLFPNFLITQSVNAEFYLKEINVSYVDSHTEGRSCTYFEYDKKNRVTKEKTFYKFNENYDTEITYKYDNKGLLVEKKIAKVQYYKSFDIYNLSVVSFEYNNKNLIKTFEIKNSYHDTAEKESPDYYHTYETLYEYDDKNKLIREELIVLSNGKEKDEHCSKEILYVYNNKSLLIEKTVINGKSNKSSYEYDNKNRLIREVIKDMHPYSYGAESSEILYEYDIDYGYLTKKVVESYAFYECYDVQTIATYVYEYERRKKSTASFVIPFLIE